jgi:hypothetical protein
MGKGDPFGGGENRLACWDQVGGTILTDASLLGSSYLELALLFALNVTGSIRNRILSPSPWVGATINPPWVPP